VPLAIVKLLADLKAHPFLYNLILEAFLVFSKYVNILKVNILFPQYRLPLCHRDVKILWSMSAPSNLVLNAELAELTPPQAF
jgi:hypothetical protein